MNVLTYGANTFLAAASPPSNIWWLSGSHARLDSLHPVSPEPAGPAQWWRREQGWRAAALGRENGRPVAGSSCVALSGRRAGAPAGAGWLPPSANTAVAVGDRR